MLSALSFSAFATESEPSTTPNNLTSNSIYMSATDKTNFAAQMDEVYAQKVKANEVKTPTRELIDSLLLQVSIGSPEEQERINAELKSYYEAWSTYWSVTCGGEWKNTDYGDFFGNVGGADGFGVGFTNFSHEYKSHVVSAGAYLMPRASTMSLLPIVPMGMEVKALVSVCKIAGKVQSETM